MIDWTLSKVSGVVIHAGYQSDEHAPRGLLERGLRSASKAIDHAALTLQWKARVNDFDDASPISSATIVRMLAGLIVFSLTSAAVRRAGR